MVRRKLNEEKLLIILTDENTQTIMNKKTINKTIKNKSIVDSRITLRIVEQTQELYQEQHLY